MTDRLNIPFPTLSQQNIRNNSTTINDNNNFYVSDINPFQNSNNYENFTLKSQFFINNNLNIYKPSSSITPNLSQNIQNSNSFNKSLPNNNIGKLNLNSTNVISETDTDLPNFSGYSNDEDFKKLDFNNNHSRIILNNFAQKNKNGPSSNTLDFYANIKKLNNTKKIINNYKHINNYKIINRKSIENINNKDDNNLKRYVSNSESLQLKNGSFVNQDKKINQKINRGNNYYNKMLAFRRKLYNTINKKGNITYNERTNDFLMNNISQNFSNQDRKINDKNSKKTNEHSVDNLISKINYGNNLKYKNNNTNNILRNRRNNFNKNFYYSEHKIKNNNVDTDIDEIVDNIQFPLFTNNNEDDKKSESDELSSIADDIVATFQNENKASPNDTKDIIETYPSTSNNENDLINSSNNDYNYNDNNNKNIIIPNSYLNNRKNKNMMGNNNKGMYDNQSTEKPTIVNNFFISQPNTQKNMNMPGSSKNINYSLFVLDNVNNNIINNNNNNENLTEMKNKTYKSPFLFKNMQNKNKKFNNKKKDIDNNYGLSDNETTTNKLKLLNDDDFEELLTEDKEISQKNNIDYFLTKKIKNFRNVANKISGFEGRSYEGKMRTNDQILNPNNIKMNLINKRPVKKNNINETTNLKEILSSKKNRNSATPGLEVNKQIIFNNYDDAKNNMEFTFCNNKNVEKRRICFNLNKNIIIAFDKDDLITKSEITSNGKLLPKIIKDMTTYQYELKIILPRPIIKPYNKEDIKINNEYVLVENLPERQILPELYDDFEDDDIKSLEKSLEKSVDKIFDGNFK